MTMRSTTGGPDIVIQKNKEKETIIVDINVLIIIIITTTKNTLKFRSHLYVQTQVIHSTSTK